MKIKESVKQSVRQAMSELRVDIDMEYCKAHGIKYKNHENDATQIDLFDKKSAKAAFDLLTKNH